MRSGIMLGALLSGGLVTSAVCASGAISSGNLPSWFPSLPPSILPPPGSEAPGPRTHGGTVAWARLKTQDPGWQRNIKADLQLLAFMRRYTSLDIDPKPEVADPDDLDELCAFPFIFAEGLGPLTAQQRRNLTEYLRRGGFLLVDTPSDRPAAETAAFVARQLAALRSGFPAARDEVLPRDDVVNALFFRLGPPPSAGTALHGIYDGSRLLAIVSVSPFQGVERTRDSHPLSTFFWTQKLMTNLYVYALVAERDERYAPPRPMSESHSDLSSPP